MLNFLKVVFSAWDFTADVFEREKYAVADFKDGIAYVYVLKLCSR